MFKLDPESRDLVDRLAHKPIRWEDSDYNQHPTYDREIPTQFPSEVATSACVVPP